MTIGEKLKSYRKTKKLSQAEVADQLHISRQTLSKWELDKSFPDYQSLKKLALLYEFSLDELFELQDEKESNLSYYTVEDLVDSLVIYLGEKINDSEKRVFFENEIIRPVIDKLEENVKIYWFAFAKGGTSIFLPVVPAKDITKQYLKLFNNSLSDLWILTNNGIVNCSIVQFLESSTFYYYFFSNLEFICIGRHYGPIQVTQFNSPSIGIFTKSRSFNWGLFREEDMRSFSVIIPSLTKANSLCIELTEFGMLKFIKKWQRGNVVKVN